VSATQIGDHRFDGDIDDLTEAGRKAQIDFSKQLLAELDKIDAKTLSRDNQVDALLLRNQLQSTSGTSRRCRLYAWDPQVYNSLAGGALYNLMARDYAPMPQRLKSATARMQKIPGLLRRRAPTSIPRACP
jgi:uncharacterized protein (DUF885 family)